MNEGAGPGELPRLIRETLDEDVRELAFPETMTDRAIHGGRARRRRGRTRTRVIAGLSVFSGAAVVGAVVLLPVSGAGDGEDTLGRRHAGPPVNARASASAVVVPRELIRVGYLPRGWRQRPAPQGVVVRPRHWYARYAPAGRADGPTIEFMAKPTTAGLAEVRRTMRLTGVRPTAFPMPVGRALMTSKAVRALREIHVYWAPRDGVLITVRAFGVPAAELRRVVRGLRVAP
ncbi:hypothetical protein [Thermomonospora umbrina]|uniref:Uncharacterized protein n=1 Tax=Thermomonospora umbrina TaxID=111806 RepID=A0A3D9SH67_9ACTN|nr:hypothetical protein [Thermomonospora umbrina]REE95249.1 hypothetical protein DFJ69_0632 [Thermomonospora umbrina]